MTTATQLLRARDVRRITGLSKSGLYRGLANGTFPKPIKLNTGPGSRAVAWDETSIADWIERCRGESGKAGAT